MPDLDKLVVLKLITGEEIVGERIESSPSPGTLGLKNILSLETVVVGPGQLVPTCKRWLLSEPPDSVHTFHPSDVLAEVVAPADFVREMYRSVFSGIQIAR